jgi:hypothetical protein
MYQMLNLATNHIINSRDIKGIKMYHKNWIKQKDPVSHYVSNDEHELMIFHIAITVPESEVTSTQQNVKDTTTVELYCHM